MKWVQTSNIVSQTTQPDIEAIEWREMLEDEDDEESNDIEHWIFMVKKVSSSQLFECEITI